MYKTPPEHSPMFGRLQTIENELAGGATGIIALIVDSKLYIASIGWFHLLFKQLIYVTNIRERSIY